MITPLDSGYLPHFSRPVFVALRGLYGRDGPDGHATPKPRYQCRWKLAHRLPRSLPTLSAHAAGQVAKRKQPLEDDGSSVGTVR